MAKKVFIDAGHGGKDPGACGNNEKEAFITLEVAKIVDVELKRHGIETCMTRTDNSTVELAQRTKKANAFKADAFVSIHCNSASSKNARGIETFCYKKSTNNELASKIHKHLVNDKSLYYSNRGLKEGNFHVLRETTMKAALVELAFISNAEDTKLLKTKQREYAISIAKGLLEYLNISYRPYNGNTNNTNSNKDTMYIVAIGAFKDIENARVAVENAKAKGFKDAYIHI